MHLPARKAAGLGVCTRTLWRWADAGDLPHIRTPARQRLYDITAFLRGQAPPVRVCYVRVSSSKQREDLDRQVSWLRKRRPEAEVVTDIGGGLNWKRKGLRSLLERAMCREKLEVVVALRDRLAHIGFELIEWIVGVPGGRFLVLNTT